MAWTFANERNQDVSLAQTFVNVNFSNVQNQKILQKLVTICKKLSTPKVCDHSKNSEFPTYFVF